MKLMSWFAVIAVLLAYSCLGDMRPGDEILSNPDFEEAAVFYFTETDARMTVAYEGGEEIAELPFAADEAEEGVRLDLPLATGDIYHIRYPVICPEDFTVTVAEYDPNEIPPTNPDFAPPRLIFTGELGRARHQDLQVQSFDTLGTITPENFVYFPGQINFPHRNLRIEP